MAYPTTAELSHSIYHTPVHTKRMGTQTVLDMHGGAGVLKKVAPDMKPEQHAGLAKAHRKAADIHDAAWTAEVQKAHKKTFGKPYNPITDYKTSGVANYDYDEASKEKLRHHARAASDHRVLAHIHNSLAGSMKEDVIEEKPFHAKEQTTRLAESAIRAAGVAKLVDTVADLAKALVDQHGAVGWGIAEGEQGPSLILRCYNPQTHAVTELDHDQYGKLQSVATVTADGMVGLTRLATGRNTSALVERTVEIAGPVFTDHDDNSTVIESTFREHLEAAGYEIPAAL